MHNGEGNYDPKNDGWEAIPIENDTHLKNLIPVKIIIRDEKTTETSHKETQGFVKTMVHAGNSNTLHNGVVPDEQLQQAQYHTITETHTEIAKGNFAIDGVEFYVTKDQKQDGSDIALKVKLTGSTEHENQNVPFILKPTLGNKNDQEIYFSTFKDNIITLLKEEGGKLQQKITKYHRSFQNVEKQIDDAMQLYMLI